MCFFQQLTFAFHDYKTLIIKPKLENKTIGIPIAIQ